MVSKRVRKKTFGRDVRAVSPVIATLMLVLIAVAAASAFYIWMAGWQKGQQKNLNNVGPQQMLTVGGSTTVYDFMTVASSLYMQNNTNYKVSVQSGGSGAGVAATASGALDIGMTSNALTAAQKLQYPNLVETVVAKDGVCVIIPTANTHQLNSMNYSTLLAIYQINGGKAGASAPSWLPAGSDGKYQWTEIPANAGSMTYMCNGTGDVKIYDRSDVSGTEEQFVKMLTGSKGQLEDIGISGATHQLGNTALVAAVAADPNGIGFGPFGFISSGSGFIQLPRGFQSSGISSAQVASVSNIKDLTYGGARLLEVLTNGAPQGDIARFINYLLEPQVNLYVCGVTGFVSIYA